VAARRSLGPSILWKRPLRSLGPIAACGKHLFLHTLGTATATTVGWGLLSRPALSPVIGAYTVFTQRIPGRLDEEGTAEAPPAPGRFLVPFDNTKGAVTSIAIANVSNANISISVGIRTPVSTTQGAAITLPPLGHASFALPAQFPSTAGQTGLAEFYGSSDGFSMISLRFSPGSFTASPVYSATGPPIIVSAP
jgi:trimeric autotransporter adhesin